MPTNKTILAHALAAAKRGIRVFPLNTLRKTPAKPGWQSIATTDAAVIERWWTENPDYNVGGVVGLALDADVKGGASGLRDLEAFDALDLTPPTYAQSTPSGGRHLLYNTESIVPNSVKRIAPGLDVRGIHGYVVLAGSRTEAGEYVALNDAPIAGAPTDLVALCGRKRERGRADGSGDGAFPDHPYDIARAKAWLARDAEPASEGSGGNHRAFVTACRLRDQGLGESTCLELMLGRWNERCEPPWDPGELSIIVSNAYCYAGGTAGAESVAAQFGLEMEMDLGAAESDGLPQGKEKTDKFVFEGTEDLMSLKPPKWLVPGWFPEWAVGIVYGQWGSGKSFIALDLLLHLAHGMPHWHGVKLPGVPVDVLLVAREGSSGFVKRVDAFRKHHGLDAMPRRLLFMRSPLNMMREAEFRLFCSAVRDTGVPFRMIVLDTLARVMPGEDMNEQKNVTLLMERCQRLGDITQATVVGVHHQNKTGSMLGSTFFEANSDFVFEVKRLGREEGPLSLGEIRCTKNKEGEDQWRRVVRYERIALAPPADFEDGDAQSSLVVASIEAALDAGNGAGNALDVIAEVLATRMERKAWKLLDVQKVMSTSEKQAAGMTDEDVRNRHHTRALAKLVDLESTTETLTSSGILEVWKVSPKSPIMVRIK